jgi:hypothetical protein
MVYSVSMSAILAKKKFQSRGEVVKGYPFFSSCLMFRFLICPENIRAREGRANGMRRLFSFSAVDADDRAGRRITENRFG